jgi:hypothetical protein
MQSEWEETSITWAMMAWSGMEQAIAYERMCGATREEFLHDWLEPFMHQRNITQGMPIEAQVMDNLALMNVFEMLWPEET